VREAPGAIGTASQAVALPGSVVNTVFPLVPSSKSADAGGWGLGDGDIETEELGESEALGDSETEGLREALGERLALGESERLALALAEALGERLALGESERLALALGETDGLLAVKVLLNSNQPG
jgi:hypothetical protein